MCILFTHTILASSQQNHNFISEKKSEDRNFIEAKSLLQNAGQDTLEYKVVLSNILRLEWSDSTKGKIFTEAGLYYLSLAHYNLASMYFERAINAFSKTDNIGDVIKNKNLLSKALRQRSKYDVSLQHSAEVIEFLKDEKNFSLAYAYNNKGVIYTHQGKKEKSLQAFTNAYNVYLHLKDSVNQALVLNNMASLQRELGDKQKAKATYLKAVELLKQTGNKNMLAAFYNNLGYLEKEESNFQEAASYYAISISLRKQTNDVAGLAGSQIGLAQLYLKQKEYNAAISKAKEALNNAKSMSEANYVMEALSLLREVYLLQNDFQQAYTYYNKWNSYKDSIDNIKNAIAIEELETKYEAREKERKIELLDKDLKNEQLQNQRQQIITYSAVIVGILLLFLLGIGLKSYNIKKKSNTQLKEYANEIELKNKDITDSITYAKRLQGAFLASNNYVKQLLPESFILFKPKDIVSGDFYWVRGTKEKVLFAVVDCTGHGVPGAFVSIVGNAGLIRAIGEKGLRKPSEILADLSVYVDHGLNHNTEQRVRDGMDISLCCYDPETKLLQYSGANNPMYLIQKGKLSQIKADRAHIGYSEEIKSFTNHEFKLEKGDCIYLFSDGYADQFGGPDGKKFKYKSFKELLLSIHDKDMKVQKQILNDTIEKWMQNEEQIDDICVIGVRV